MTFLEQLLHLFYVILYKLYSTYVDSAEVIIFQGKRKQTRALCLQRKLEAEGINI